MVLKENMIWRPRFSQQGLSKLTSMLWYILYVGANECYWNALCYSSQKLDQVLDFENDGVPTHLGKIADAMHEWEGSIAERLGLTEANVAAIKTEHPWKLELQTWANTNVGARNFFLFITCTCSRLIINVYQFSGEQHWNSGSKIMAPMLPTGI